MTPIGWVEAVATLFWTYAGLAAIEWAARLSRRDRREHLPLVFEMIGHLVPAMIALLLVVLAGAFLGFPSVVVIIAVLFPAGLATGFHMGLNDLREATWRGRGRPPRAHRPDRRRASSGRGNSPDRPRLHLSPNTAGGARNARGAEPPSSTRPLAQGPNNAQLNPMPKTAATRVLIALNLSLLVLYPVAWMAPLMRAGLLPLFGLDEISVLSGIGALWSDGEVALAAIVILFALVAPIAKTICLTLIHLSRLPARLLPALQVLGKLAMADVFLIAVYITLAKGIAVGRVETAWGLWLFTGCVLVSLGLGVWTARLVKETTP
jgi:paraquat-inducible protein A